MYGVKQETQVHANSPLTCLTVYKMVKLLFHLLLVILKAFNFSKKLPSNELTLTLLCVVWH